MRLGVTIPSRTGAMANVPRMAARADAAGFDSTWVYEVYRNPFTMLGTLALETENVALGTGLAAAFPRSPFETANAAADIDEMSGGRMILGIGTGVPEFLRRFHSTDATTPLGRLSEYIEVLRRSFEYLNTGDTEKFEGKHYRFDPLRMNPWGVRDLPRAQVPVYLAAMGPKLLELCGRKADGWLGYFATPEFMEQSVTPKIAVGVEKAGRSMDDVETTVFNICCVHPDRDVAMERARKQVGFYVVHPVSDGVVALHGLQDQVAELRGRMRAEGLAAFEHTDEALVETLSLTGTPEEVRQKAERYEGVVGHLALHTPYVPPFTPEESEDCFDQIVATFADRARVPAVGAGTRS